jgi:hypothetical protein
MSEQHQFALRWLLSDAAQSPHPSAAARNTSASVKEFWLQTTIPEIRYFGEIPKREKKIK